MTSSKKLEMIFPPKIFGQIQLLNENNDIVLAIRMHENVFAFGPRSTPGSWKERVHKVFQIFTGGNIVVEIHLNKYYVSTNITSRHIKNLLINKFWPAEWWNGGFMKNISNAQLRIYGDFVLVTPVFINVVKEEDVFEKYSMPFSDEIDQIISKIIIFNFYCMIKENATKFYIKLMHGVSEENKYIGHTVYSLNVDFDKNEIKTYSKHEQDRYAQTTKITSFKRGKPVEFKITIFGVLDSHTEINTLVNDINLFERVLYARLPVWMINRITMGGDIYLYDYTKQEGRPEPNTYKKLLKELKSYGTILCFTAKVMKKEEMFEEVGFEVHLNHDPYNKDYIDRVLVLRFSFASENYKCNGEPILFGMPCNGNLSYIQEGESELTLRSRINYLWGTPEIHINPIGTGVSIRMLVYANEKQYVISINGGDYIYYQHRIPPWAVNHITIRGSVTDIVFDEQGCQHNFQEYEKPKNLYRVEGGLTNRKEIIIKGKTPKPFRQNISVNLFHGAIEWNQKIGHTIFQLNITRKCSSVNSYTNGEWIHKRTEKIAKCHKHKSL
ncbi:hypothetical protein ACQ4LE_011000, partial [Meloidogyne hapla]